MLLFSKDLRDRQSPLHHPIPNIFLASSPQYRHSVLTPPPSPFGSETGHLDESQPEPGNLGQHRSEAMSSSATTLGPSRWEAIIPKISKSVVVIQCCQPYAFDTGRAWSYKATGFVVDEKRGLILTNRHVLPGPFFGIGTFAGGEKCNLQPVYFDHIHDYGFLKFNPQAIEHMNMSSLQLRPESAQVGVEIKVIGNDAGEKLSVLSGVISRLDRNAPDYGDSYCDFNTNYLQASSAATGGSSGSPVINDKGDVVGMAGGGRVDATTNFFLPLQRPLHALRCLQKGEPIRRGTIQVQWILEPFDQCRKLGLSPHWEMAVRQMTPEQNMLVAKTVLPEGPADGKVRHGDILIQVNNEILTSFIRLDEILDSSVEQDVDLLILRGGKEIQVCVSIQSLDSITPSRFVTVAGGTFHDLSYQKARYHAIAIKGVWVCEAFSGKNCLSGAIIDAINQKPTPNLDRFIEVMNTIPTGSRIVVSYKHLANLNAELTTVVQIFRRWDHEMRLVTRNETTGLWDSEILGNSLPEVPLKTMSATFLRPSDSRAENIVRSFVRVERKPRLVLDNTSSNNTGYGLVIDASRGLVLISRDITPHSLCEVTITIANSIITNGKVIFLHPTSNYAIVRYDAQLVDAPVESAHLSEDYIQTGDAVIFVGFNGSDVCVTDTIVARITPFTSPASSSFSSYRVTNIDAITVATPLSELYSFGVLLSAAGGCVKALWCNALGSGGPEYNLGLATPTFLPAISWIRRGIESYPRILGIEAKVVEILDAQSLGVPEEWIQRVVKADPAHHRLFMAQKVSCISFPIPADVELLRGGDIILSLNDQLITSVSQLGAVWDLKTLDALIIRKGEVKHLKIPSIPIEEMSRVVIFCGAVLQQPNPTVFEGVSKLPSKVYVSSRKPGSPAQMHDLKPTRFITHVNGVATQDLDSFMSEIRKTVSDTNYRLDVATLDGHPSIVCIKQNVHYFPTVEYVRRGDEWERHQ